MTSNKKKDNVNELLGITDTNKMEYLYLNKHRIHDELYEKDINIFVEPNMIGEFKDYYYLYLLIKEEPEIINYKYDYELIKNLDKIVNSDGNSTIKKILLSKMLLTFINNYEQGLEEEQNQHEDELSKLKTKYESNISENKNILEKYMLDLNESLEKYKIDLNKLEANYISIIDIYSIIIIHLIKNNKLDESEETINILKELEIKNLKLNQELLDSLNEVLNEKYLSKYKILNYNDLFKQDKLIFYYILFEYILKSSEYVSKIRFLLETRDKIVKLIKENLDDFRSVLKKWMLLKVLGYFIENDKDDLLGYDPYDEIKEYTVGNSKTLKIGIIGDTQLISLSHHDKFYKQFTENIKKTLKILKEKKINVLIIDGDITNCGYSEAYDNFLTQFNSVYGDEKKQKFQF